MGNRNDCHYRNISNVLDVRKTSQILAGDREDGLSGLLDLAVDTGNDHEDNHGKERSEKGGEGILRATVLGDTHDLGNGPADEIHPGHGGGEGETTNDRVEGLGLELLGDDIDGLEGLGNGGHCI